MTRDYLRYLSIAICLCLPCVAWGQSQADRTKDVDTAGLVIEPVAGWGNSVDPTTPVPISFLIENFSDETIEGRLFLSAPYNKNRKIDLGEVFIGPASKRRFSTIRGDLDNIYECYAEIQVEGKVIWRRQVPLATNSSFSQDVVHCLFISDAERNLNLPQTKKPQNANAPQSPVANKSGRRAHDLTVKSWQVPDHPGALSVAQGIVFEENFDAKLLNRAQWNAIANWMCQGGNVFVHDKSQNIIKKLLASSPLSSSAPTQSDDQFIVREAGLGKICEYSEPLFSSDKATRQSIANRMSVVPRTGIRSLAQQSSIDRRASGNASWNRLFLLTFFGAYAILSGLVTMLLFRLSRRQIAIYTMTVVIGACIAAAMLGGCLLYTSPSPRD